MQTNAPGRGKLTTGPSGALSSVVGLVLSILYVMGAKENKDAHAMAGKV